MSAITGPQRTVLKKELFSARKRLAPLANRFGRQRAQYLSSIVAKEKTQVSKIEREILVRIEKSKSEELKFALQKKSGKILFLRYLRLGFPFSNAARLVELDYQHANMYPYEIPGRPGYRRREVLEIELKIKQIEYESLRLVRRAALQRGFFTLATDLQRKIERVARVIAFYNRTMSPTRLIEN